VVSDSNGDPEDLLGNAGRAFEEHERELLEELMARVQRDISEGATVSEAVAEMRRAATEDDDARELLLRLAVMQNQNHGYIRSHFEHLSARLADPRSRVGPEIRGRPLSQEELELTQKLGEEIDRRLPPDLSEEERDARVVKLLEEDEELAKMAARLERLAAGGGVTPPWDEQP